MPAPPPLRFDARTFLGARIHDAETSIRLDFQDGRIQRLIDEARQLADAGAQVEACDPWADPGEVARQGVALVPEPEAGRYDAVVLAVAHDVFRRYDADQVRALGRAGAAVYDVKSVWPREAVDERL